MPIEEEVELYQHSHVQERQKPKKIKPEEIRDLLQNLEVMDKPIAKGFILGMRLYHSAVEMMYTEPEFSYLFLITCLEAVSSALYQDYRPDNEEEFLESRFHELRALLDSLSEEKRTRLKEMLLRNEKFVFQKLTRFVSENVPERFWSETEDDTKPDNPPGRSDQSISNLEKIDRENLEQVLKDVYNARSRLIHEGKPLPKTIVIGLFPLLQIQVVSEIDKEIRKATRPGQQPMLPIPPLLTFERLVSYSMGDFLAKQQQGV